MKLMTTVDRLARYEFTDPRWLGEDARFDQWESMCDEIDRLRSAVSRVAELIVGNCPMWSTLPEAYHCSKDREHQQWIDEFVTDLQRIIHPLRPDMVAAPLASRATA